MLRYLFPRLTSRPQSAAALFDAVTAQARQPHWYRESEVPDEIDGRFRVLATICALVTVRLDGLGAREMSVALTERFIEVMESEHRELGLGDPTLGKTVRRLVSSLGRRVEIWRGVVGSDEGWDQATRESLYVGEIDSNALEHSVNGLRALWVGLGKRDLVALSEGRL